MRKQIFLWFAGMILLLGLLAAGPLFAEEGGAPDESLDAAPGGVASIQGGGVGASSVSLELLKTFPLTTNGQQGIASDGEYFYTCYWQSPGKFSKYDAEGSWIEDFTIAGVGNLRNLTYDGTWFYGGAAGMEIYKLDLVNKVLVSTIATPVNVRHITYDPPSGGFWVGDWSDLYLIDSSGAVVFTGPALNDVYGTAYDPYSDGGPYLWLFSQSYAIDGGTSARCFLRYDIDGNTLESTGFDVPSSDSGAIAGGAFSGPYGNNFVLMGNVQTSPNQIVIYKLADLASLEVSATPNPVQYSDRVDLKAILTEGYLDGVAKKVEFLIDGRTVGWAPVDENGIAELHHVRIFNSPTPLASQLGTGYEVKAILYVEEQAQVEGLVGGQQQEVVWVPDLEGTSILEVVKEDVGVRYAGQFLAFANKRFVLGAVVYDTDTMVGMIKGLPVQVEVAGCRGVVYTTTAEANALGYVLFESPKLARGTYKVTLTVLGNDYYNQGASSWAVIVIR